MVLLHRVNFKRVHVTQRGNKDALKSSESSVFDEDFSAFRTSQILEYHIRAAQEVQATRVETCLPTQSINIEHRFVESCRNRDGALCFGNRLTFTSHDENSPSRPRFPSSDMHAQFEKLRQQRCAFVTHEDGVKEGCGAHIDSTPIVFRANCAPSLTESPTRVGTRTTVQIMNWQSAEGLGVSNGTTCAFPAVSWRTSKGGFENSRQPVITLAFDAKLDNKTMSLFRVVENHHPHIHFRAFTNTSLATFIADNYFRSLNMTAYPSSGFVALLLAARYCSHLSVYGYGASNFSVWRGHNFTSEVEAWRKLTQNNNLMVFHEN